MNQQRTDQPGPEKERPWTRQEIKLLGTRPDREIARLTRRDPWSVQAKRLDLGIRSWKRVSRRVGEPLEPEKAKLLFGPYAPPRVRRGKFIFCELRGTVKVGNYSDGPIPWPRKWKTCSIILCGTLVQAVRQESELAVAEHWGVSTSTVTKWRQALGVEPINPGTQRLKSFVQTEAMTPALRTHISRLHTGKPRRLTRAGEARLMAALHRPKSPQWFKSMAGHFQARRGKLVNPAHQAWTPEEERLVGTMSDREVARLLNRSVGSVSARRTFKKIPYAHPVLRAWTEKELGWLGKLRDETIARRTGRSLKSVRTKRQELGRLVRPHPRPWTTQEERLLGKQRDGKLATLFRRSRSNVRKRRVALGIKPIVERFQRAWTPEEEKLLGTASDAKVGRKLGRSLASVQFRRLRLGLPSHRQRRS